MKRFNRLIAVVVILFLLAGGVSFLVISKNNERKDNDHVVEVNRIMKQIKNPKDIESLDFSSCSWVIKITYVNAKEVSNTFLAPTTDGRTVFSILDAGEERYYLKFLCRHNDETNATLWFVEMLVLISFVIVMGILFYIKYQIIVPFNRLSEVPEKLSKGNLNAEITENKGRYFGKFIWGINMLKDRLAYEKNKELKLEKEKKMLLVSISHDMKTPLNNIRLYVKAIEEGIYETKEKQMEALQLIETNAVKIENFIAEVIKTSSEDIIEIEVHNTEFYIKELMEALKDSYEEKLKLRNIDFCIDKYDNKLLKGDLSRSIEVMENIIENALKYGDGKQIAILFSQEEDCQLIEIRNSGTPIPKEAKNHVFESFYRGANAEGMPGNGLGLYICREIMKKMQGEIFVTAYDDGTGFTLVFRQ